MSDHAIGVWSLAGLALLFALFALFIVEAWRLIREPDDPGD